MALNLGGIIRLTYAVKNDLGAATNPATATCAITQPDGVTVTPTVTLPPSVTGQLVLDFTPTQAGLHSVHWATTAPTTAEDDAFVAERPGSLFISVDEAIAHLRAGGIITSDADREQVQWLCMVASDAVERDLGRTIARRTVTEVYDGGRVAISLRSTPVISITSVTESGTLLTAGDYVPNLSTGILYRGSTTSGLWFGWGRQNVTIVYVAGYLDPPRVAREGAKQLVQSFWQSSQQASHPLLDESSVEAFVSAALPGLSRIPGYDSLRAPGIA